MRFTRIVGRSLLLVLALVTVFALMGAKGDCKDAGKKTRGVTNDGIDGGKDFIDGFKEGR